MLVSPRTGAGALSGLRVVDAGTTVASAFCTRALAGFGAHVVYVEPPSGSALRSLPPFLAAEAPVERSALAQFLLAAKESLALDASRDADRSRFQVLAAACDILVADEVPRLERFLREPWREWSGAHPSVTLTMMTPYGVTGPYATYPASDLSVNAWGGLLHTTGWPYREPLKQGGQQTAYQAGSFAAVASIASALGVKRGLTAGLVDCAAMEAVSTMLDPNIYWNVVDPDKGGRWAAMSRRLGNQSPGAPRGLWPCKDGWVMVIPRLDRAVESLATLTGDDRFRDERFQTLDGQSKYADEIVALLLPWLMERTREEIYHLAQEAGHYFGYLVTVDELPALRQLRAREFFGAVEHPELGQVRYPGPPARLGRTPWLVEGAPRVNEHTEVSSVEELSRTPGKQGPPDRVLPLDGVRVIDLTRAWAGPLATKLLADLGADVVKVHAIGVRDHRWDPTRSAYWRYLDGNKRAIGLDITVPDGKAVLRSLVQSAGCLVENFSPRVLPGLGLGYEDLKELCSDLVMVSMPGFGSTGPERDYRALGETIEALSGLMSLTGYRDDDSPMKSGVNYGDPIAGVTAAFAAITALFHRQQTGEGQCVEVSHLEAAVNWLGEWVVASSITGDPPTHQGNGSLLYAPEGVYPTRDEDSWVAISAPRTRDWRALADFLGIPRRLRDLAAKPRFARRDELDSAIAEHTATLSRQHIVAELLARDVPVAPVLTGDEVIADPHLASRGFWEEVRLEGGPVTAYPYHRAPFLLAGGSAGLRRPPPSFSEHLREVLLDWGGLSTSRIEQLIEHQVVAEIPVGSAGRELRL